jgi:hypothetical protein
VAVPEELARDELIALVRKQAGTLSDLRAENTALQEKTAEVEALREANARLEKRLGEVERALSRNSGNSSMSPSSDELPGRRKPARKKQTKKGSGRKPGKQPGAKGSALPWVAHPNEYVPHRPAGQCDCGAELAEAADVRIADSHQVHDLPEQVQVTVTQHDVYQVRCCCGREHVGSLLGEISAAPASYGVNLQALVVYLLIYQHVPVERCVRLIADISGGTGPSVGFCHGMLARAAKAVSEVVATIKALITAAAVVGFDETTLRAGEAGTKKYVLSASTDWASLYHLGGRDLDSFAEAGVLPGFAGIAVHDRYANYFNPRWEHLAGHQACAAHLLRDLTDAAETYPKAAWPAQAARALRALVRAWHRAREQGLPAIPEAVRASLSGQFRRAVRVGLAEIPRIPGPRGSTAQRPGRELLEFCSCHEHDVLRFTADTRVFPTNNISERDLRPTKTQQKISGRLTSEDTTQDRLDIRSYLDTARKNGINLMTALRQALSGHPWRPPSLAPA